MLIQYNLNKWWLIQAYYIETFFKMPHQQRLDKDQFYDAYNNSVYPNYSHFHIIAYNAAS